MDAITEKARSLAFILSEANGYLSREVLTIASGAGKLEAGTVLGKLAVGAATAAAKSGGNTGNGTISAVTVLNGAKAGVYALRFTAATTWALTDPDGFSLANGANGAANANDIGFTTTAGGTPFIAGDGFDITVAAGSGVYWPSTHAAVANKAGIESASAILAHGVDATSAAVDAVCITNDAEVKEPMLLFDASVDDDTKRAAKIAQLRAISRIKAR
jgi:hypothetical protein